MKTIPRVLRNVPVLTGLKSLRTSTYVGSLFSKRLHDAEVRTLSHFGHEVFAPRLGTAATLENMPVTPDYVVGPGDEVIVRLWGRMEGTHRLLGFKDLLEGWPRIHGS